MNKEAAMIVGLLMAVLGLLGVVLTPESKEHIEYIIVTFVTLGGSAMIRSFVASKFSVQKNGGQEAYERVFEGKRGPSAKNF